MTMTCPVCGEPTVVIDTYSYLDCVYRRRKCKACNHRFNTEEVEASNVPCRDVILRRKREYERNSETEETLG